MKKIILFVAAVIVTLPMMSFTVVPEMEGQMSSSGYASTFESITVYKITIVGRNGAAATQSVQAEFDKNNMELRVEEKRNGKKITMTYSVVQNPYKGYSDDVRGRYNYNADCYYW